MQYMGGKSRLGPSIAEVIEDRRLPGSSYWEPFVGGCNIVPHISGRRAATDCNRALITLYRSYQQGWRPPQTVDESLYLQLKAHPDVRNPLVAFAGFGCSYGGKWFGGFARDPINGRNFAATAARALDKKMSSCSDVLFKCSDYTKYPEGLTIYADPPYADTTQYGIIGLFDSVAFWEWARRISQTNTLIVSEYHAPPDFSCIADFPVRKSNFAGPQVERLFQWNP